MDISEEYIEMCNKAGPIQNIKFENGYHEGDYIECDGKVRIVGHDFISLDEKLKVNPWNVFRFAMLSSTAAGFSTINCEDLPHEIALEYGEYIIEYIKNPLWLPCQDQLQDMLEEPLCDFNNYSGMKGFKRHLGLIGELHEFAARKHGYKTNSMEQLWLAFVMHEKYDRRWDGSNWVKS
ncbi:MAG: hypothetical protein KAJ19_29795 [Gammaproteobacteria bacterium]|nr:hypothetical protein [Gammaproteobacteria bacterium]